MCHCHFVFFFKQQTAYEMRISDWSSDVCSSDLRGVRADSCMRLETAINHSANHALHAYHRCPRPMGFGKRIGRIGGQLHSNSQPNGLYACPRILANGSRSDWNNLAEHCFRLIDDKWIPIQIRLRFGPRSEEHTSEL